MENDTTTSDEALVTAFRRGDQSAATALVHRYGRPLARFLHGRGVPPSDLEDVVQETFFKAFRSLDQWRGDAGFRRWLYRIALNAGRDHWRRSRGRGMDHVTIEHDTVEGTSNPELDLDRHDTAARIRVRLGTLTHMQREVFLLRAQEGLEYPEIAGMLGTTPGAARVHYHHAVRRLKECVA